MADLNRLRDQITETLAESTRKMTPLETFAQIGQAATQTIKNPTVTFGDALSAMKAQKITAAKEMAEFLRAERGADIDERAVSVQEGGLKVSRGRLLLDQMEALSKKGEVNSTAVLNAIKSLPEDRRERYMEEMDALPYEVNTGNVVSVIGRISRNLRESGEFDAKSAGPYQGTSVEAQHLNTILSGDPNSREYELAYHELYGKPRLQMTEEGMRYVQIPPPAGVRPPGSTTLIGGPAGGGMGGGASAVIPGTEKTKQYTTEQSTAAGYANRMSQAEGRMRSISEKTPGFDPASFMQNVFSKTGTLGNIAMSSEHQQYFQAAQDWVRAKLRKESGAVIGEEEMAAEIKNYFPQPGDSPQVIKQKTAARRTAFESMVGQSQGAFGGLFGEENIDPVNPDRPDDPLGILD